MDIRTDLDLEQNIEFNKITGDRSSIEVSHAIRYVESFILQLDRATEDNGDGGVLPPRYAGILSGQYVDRIPNAVVGVTGMNTRELL